MSLHWRLAGCHLGNLLLQVVGSCVVSRHKGHIINRLLCILLLGIMSSLLRMLILDGLRNLLLNVARI